MESTRNPTGRRSDSGSRIQLKAGLWDPACYPVRKIAAKIISLQRSEELRSPRMKFTVKSTDSAKSVSGAFSSFENFRFHRFRFTQIPPQPLFPRLQSGHQLFQRPSPQKPFPRNPRLPVLNSPRFARSGLARSADFSCPIFIRTFSKERSCPQVPPRR